jgi:signal transduction histidine kinase
MLFGALLFLAFTTVVVIGLVSVIVYAVNGLASVPLAVLLPIALVVLVVVVVRRAVRTWRPVRDLIDAAGALADGDYSVRVKPGGSASVRRVVASFNDMARRLESADEQRRQLLADLGHELRTPLTVVRGEVEAMIDGVHRPDAEHLELVVAEVAVMERLLEDLRTLSLLDAGSLALHPEPTDLGQLVTDVADTHRRRAAEAGVTIEVTTAAPPIEAVVDPVRMREVLSNLVVNALRAMPDGGTLRFEVSRSGPGPVIRVADTGVGIDPDDLDRVFDRFHKGSGSGGSGLGLSISRDLVAAHGGTLTIESQPGSGTVATVDLAVAD